MNHRAPDQPLRITHVITGLGRGGAETMLLKLVETLPVAAGFTHTIISLTAGGPNDLEIPGVPVVNLGLRRGTANPLALLRLRRMVRALAPDILQGWMYHGNLAARLAASGEIPVVFNIRHSLTTFANEKPSVRISIRLGAFLARRRVARVLYCSQTSRKQHEALGYPAEKSLFIPNGFDSERFRPAPQASQETRQMTRSALGLALPDAALLIAHVARYHPIKNHAGLIRSFKHLSQREPRAHLLLMGHGVNFDNQELRGVITDLALENRIHVLGERQDIARLLPVCDLLVSSSRGEAFPNVLGEAMSCGLPCVATDVGDSGAILGSTGRVVPADDEAALTAAMAEILALPQSARQALGQAARERVIAEFNLPAVAQRYADLYRGLKTRSAPDVQKRDG